MIFMVFTMIGFGTFFQYWSEDFVLVLIIISLSFVLSLVLYFVCGLKSYCDFWCAKKVRMMF